MSVNKKNNVNSNMSRKNKYDMAIELFYAISLFISIGVCLIVGFVFDNSRVWGIAAVGSGILFLVLGLTAQVIITLVRKDSQYNND